MKLVAPIGPVYQAGTLSGNPLAMAAGMSTINGLRKKGTYKKLNGMTRHLVKGMDKILKKHGINARINSIGSMFTIFFTESDVVDYESALKSDTKIYARFFKSLLKAGIMFPPSQFEAVFVSLAHKESDIDVTLKAFSRVAKSL
jgi:glutamate-1-semialdehyde 2,1-aminomutase